MSVRGKTAEMVQPSESPGSDYPVCGGGPAGASFEGVAPLPPELINHEAFQRLWVENKDLRDALTQSNLMLRKRHSEMLEFQDAQRKEREFITYKFTEARNLVQRLTEERNSLHLQLGATKQPEKDAVAKEEKKANAEGEKQEEATVTDQKLPKKPANEEDNASPGNSLSSCETLTHSVCETIRPMVQDYEGPARAQQDTKDRGALTDAEIGERFTRAEQELQRKLHDSEHQNSQLVQQIMDLKEELSNLKHQTVEKATETQRKVLLMQQQLDQVTEEKVTIKAQVTSLLGELNESQNRLEGCMQEKSKLEERLQVAREVQLEGETLVKQHMMQLDQRRMQVQNLETALKIERQKTCEEMRKLAQLQAAYHQLFQEYDAHIKSTLQVEKHGGRVQELKQQLQEAEEALVAKQDLIDKLKEEAEKMRETTDVLKAQVEIYRLDFLAEREAREKLHAEKERLQEQLEGLKQERSIFEGIRNRHLDIRPTLIPGPYPGSGSYAHPPMSSFSTVMEPEPYCCPKCQYKAPDMDTLQIHIMDCIK
ncbi:NF-kappa-B essential modulator isoform X1 [Bombina bombina]|uniref:NF-kappa-B essential modulator isoform X1 n=1 Tax=Bombina bombina TaxID=8345 RepID=UPI00235A858C|nr:NF-kappa-B essential modulator isoform X1 [Bombina bombina]XP_053551910.1 NF-kappa-B essential modulator isoform X1 [Bombina bombina]XP_053551911.1 NF-kappa-B essential modulator isoform X1 [Bombina bombina]